MDWRPSIDPDAFPSSPVRKTQVSFGSPTRQGLGASHPQAILSPKEKEMTSSFKPSLMQMPSSASTHLSNYADLVKRTYSSVNDSTYYTPSDRIGRNYSPLAQGLTMKVLKAHLMGRGKKMGLTGAKPKQPSTSPLMSGSASLPKLRSKALPKPVSTLVVSPSRQTLSSTMGRGEAFRLTRNASTMGTKELSRTSLVLPKEEEDVEDPLAVSNPLASSFPGNE